MNGWTKWLTAGLTVLGVLAMAAPAIAVFGGKNGDIAFVSGRGAGGDASADVYIVSGPGATAGSPLTTADGQHRHPNFSPDGSQVAYALFNGATQRDIWVHNIQLGGRTNITQTPTVIDDRPAFSPDGTRVAYESEVTAGSGQQDILITTLGPGGGTINLTNTGIAVEGKPIWSPDGQYIYYSRRASQGATDEDILRERSDNSSVVPESILISATAEYQPSLSPDGSKLCFTRGNFGTAAADVYTVASNGLGPQTDISDNVGANPENGDYNCVWSPDGKKIAFVAGVFGQGQLVYKNSDDTGSVEPLIANNADNVFDGNPDWVRAPQSCQGKPATVYGTLGKDTLVGTQGRDVIVGLAGNDTIRGRGGNDIICGGAGKDRLLGQGGRDKLFGGVAADDLRGGPGKDSCVGGPGKDKAKSCEKKKSV